MNTPPLQKKNLELKLPKKLLKNIYNIIFVNQCITMFLKVLPCGRLLWSNENNVDVIVQTYTARQIMGPEEKYKVKYSRIYNVYGEC